MPPRTPKLPGAGDVIAGKYRLERLLRQGGMGAVWIATHLGLDEQVAVKFMDPRRVSSAEARMRFTREAKAAAQIRSKNIVQILDHGVDNGIPYITMELLSGEDLGARLRRAGKLSLLEASALLDHIAHALDRAHAAGIVHRDLKPENIFLAKDGDHEMPKILDFGIALEVQPDASDDSAVTQEGVILGTPYFMSPEQVRGRTNVDHRSDLWSLGVILFRAITGIRPFGRGAPADVIVQICSDPIPRASVVARDLPEDVDRFFEKALARDLAKRFSSAKEMAAAFGEVARITDPNESTQQDPPAALRDRRSSRDRPSSRGGAAPTPAPATKKGPPPLPGAVVADVPHPPAAQTRKIPALAGIPHSDRTGGAPAPAPPEEPARAFDRETVPAPQPLAHDRPDGTTPLAATAQPDAAVELTPEPLSDRASEVTPIAAAITGTLPTTEISSPPAAIAPKTDVTIVSPAPRPPAETPTTSSFSQPPETPRSADARRPEGSRSLPAGPVSARSKEPRSALWAAAGLVLGMVIAGAAFREKLFGPPPGTRDPSGAATIVLTAGTVVLVSPGMKPPAEPSATASAASSASASIEPEPPVPATAASSAAAPSASASTAPAATSTASASSAPLGPGTVPVVVAKPTATSTAKTPPTPTLKPTATAPKKDERDLGY